MKKGILIILSGPSGVGKGTLRKRLIEMHPELNLQYSISMTTRKPREGEVDGKDYFFVSEEDFKNNIKSGNLIEYTKFVGNYYGTPRDYVEKLTNESKNVILEIDIEGAKKVMKTYNPQNLLSIFITARSIKVIEDRIRNRRTESEEQIKERLNKAKKEMHLSYIYDFVVINDDLDRAANEIAECINNRISK